MAYGDPIRSAIATYEQVAALIEGIFSSGFPLTWGSWTPTYGATGSMTYTSITTDTARYIQVGKLVFFILRCFGTVSGTPSGGITFTAPVNNVSAFGADATSCSGFTFDAGANVSAFGLFSSASTIQVSRYNAANFTAGTVYLNMFGIYRSV